MEVNEKENIEAVGVCMCCSTSGYVKNIWANYFWSGEKEVYGRMLLECFDITIDENDKDIGICDDCIIKLRDALNFKIEVLNIQLLLAQNYNRAVVAMMSALKHLMINRPSYNIPDQQ